MCPRMLQEPMWGELALMRCKLSLPIPKTKHVPTRERRRRPPMSSVLTLIGGCAPADGDGEWTVCSHGRSRDSHERDRSSLSLSLSLSLPLFLSPYLSISAPLPELNSRNSSLRNPIAAYQSQLDSPLRRRRQNPRKARVGRRRRSWSFLLPAIPSLSIPFPLLLLRCLRRQFSGWATSLVSRTALYLLTFGSNSNLFAAFSLLSQVHK